MSKEIYIAGIDPSMSNLGVVRGSVDLDTLTPKIHSVSLTKTTIGKDKSVRKSSDDFDRARILYAGLQEACRGAHIAMVEMPIGSQSAAAMKSYGMCIGLLASVQIPIIQVNPAEVKFASVGIKNATKRQMIEWAHGLYPNAEGWLTRKVKGEIKLTDANEHLADATGAVHAGIDTDQFKQAVAMMKSLQLVA